jgi:hypothetical protein
MAYHVIFSGNVNRDHSFFTVHETEKTVRRNYLSQFVKNKYISITIRIFRFISDISGNFRFMNR